MRNERDLEHWILDIVDSIVSLTIWKILNEPTVYVVYTITNFFVVVFFTEEMEKRQYCIFWPLGLNVVGNSAICLSRLCQRVRDANWSITRHSRMSTRQPAISSILWPGPLMPWLENEDKIPTHPPWGGGQLAARSGTCRPPEFCFPPFPGNHKVLTHIEYRAVSGAFRTIDPPPPLRTASVSSPRTKGGGGGVHTSWAVRGWGVNIMEDARHWIGLLHYNSSTQATKF